MFEPPIHHPISLPQVFSFLALLQWVYCQNAQVTTVASFGGLFFFAQYCHTHVTSSAGRMGSSTEPPSIQLGLFVISGTTVTHAPFSLYPTTSLLSTPTGGIKYELHSVPATPPHGTIATDNYFVCTGTQRLSNIPDLLFPLTSSTRITKSLSRES